MACSSWSVARCLEFLNDSEASSENDSEASSEGGLKHQGTDVSTASRVNNKWCLFPCSACIHNIATLVFQYVLRMNQSLSEDLSGFEVHWDVMFKEKPSKVSLTLLTH